MQLKIMPLGDSNTRGEGVDTAGYRNDLWQLLTSSGISVDFVGSLSNGPSGFTDNQHDGHGGWRIDEIAAGRPQSPAAGSVNDWLSASQPDIVLLMIGTNDVNTDYLLGTAPDRLRSLLDQIFARIPSLEVLIGSIPPIDSSGTGDPNDLQQVIDFNAAIPGIVDEQKAAGKKIRFVDVFNRLTVDDLLDDGIHPTPSGYAKVANAWYEAILESDLVNNNNPSFRIEAESLTLSGGYRTESNSSASNGALIRSDADRGSPATAVTQFRGSAGIYKVAIGYYDENDGQAQLLINIGGSQYSVILDQDLARQVNSDSFVELTLDENLSLSPGDTIEITGIRDEGELARVDYIEFTLVAEPSIFSFSAAEYTVAEDGMTSAAVTIIRSGGTTGEASITVVPSNGSAIAPDDYDATPIVVTFADGETQKTVQIPIVDDAIEESTETITLALESPSSGATVGSLSSSVLSVLDNDTPDEPPGEPPSEPEPPTTPPGSGTGSEPPSSPPPVVSDETETVTPPSPEQVLTGTNARDRLVGGPSSDILSGKGNDDVLVGKGGSDILKGGAGDDVLKGGSGDDVLAGGAGDDKLLGGSGNDLLRGGGGSDKLNAGSGFDVVNGGGGNDLVKGGRDNDLLRGNAGNDTLSGKGQDDVLVGGSGDDTLFGGGGRDRLDGEKGNDVLDGGGGKDIFVLSSNHGLDTIRDFQSGQDKIELLGQLQFSDLNIFQLDDSTMISIGNRKLALLVGIDATSISGTDFI